MSSPFLTSHHFDLCACLPFVELAHEASIQVGPLIFWPASKSQEFLGTEAPSFQAYLQSIEQIKARRSDDQTFIPTMRLQPRGMTCISIDAEVPSEQRKLILIDALYLLYFACTFRNLYYGQEIPSFNAFRKMIPASLDFIKTKQNWDHLYIHETYREEPICIHLVDPTICQGLGEALDVIYKNSALQDQAQVQKYKRLVRSIRYLVDRFFQRFVNLLGQGLHLSDQLFEPEDVVFLATSFEALFNLNDKQPAADFKHKLRALLHLKYGRPVEFFWKWVDDFYNVKYQIVRGNSVLDPIFRANPNFEVSHILLGMKLFIYSVYYKLLKYKLISSVHEDPYTPPDFKWIHREEVLQFFWTESNLLHKIDLFLKQIPQVEEANEEELYADIHFMSRLFVSLDERYAFGKKGGEAIHFIPESLADLQGLGHPILEKLKQDANLRANERLWQSLHPRFIEALDKRLKEI